MKEESIGGVNGRLGEGTEREKGRETVVHK